MNASDIQKFCKTLKGTTQDVKWGHDLCYMVGGKMYCVHSLKGPLNTSFKTTPEEFGELIERNGIIPAPYVAKHHWVRVEDPGALRKKEWELYIQKSYALVVDKLPKKVKNDL